MFKIFPYNTKSKSALLLKEALSAEFIDPASHYKDKYPNDVVINWGTGYKNAPLGSLNQKVLVGINKLTFFKDMAAKGLGHLLPAYWTSSAAIPPEAFPVVCRTVLDGKDGEGIVIANTKAELVSAKLYTKLIPAVKEYRIHVGRYQHGMYSVILVQHKGKKNNSPNTNTIVKTSGNDYVFVHGETAPQAVQLAAIKVFEKTGMDFGGLDVVYDGTNAYVLEVNSAPELGSIACAAYRTFFETFEAVKPVLGADIHDVLDGSGTESRASSGQEAIGGLGQATPEVHGNVLGKSASGGPVETSGIGMVAVVSGGDTDGLMKQIEKAIQAKIDAAKAQGYKEGLAQAPKGFTKADLDAAEAKGAASVKAALKSLLAA